MADLAQKRRPLLPIIHSSKALNVEDFKDSSQVPVFLCTVTPWSQSSGERLSHAGTPWLQTDPQCKGEAASARRAPADGDGRCRHISATARWFQRPQEIEAKHQSIEKL